MLQLIQLNYKLMKTNLKQSTSWSNNKTTTLLQSITTGWTLNKTWLIPDKVLRNLSPSLLNIAKVFKSFTNNRNNKFLPSNHLNHNPIHSKTLRSSIKLNLLSLIVQAIMTWVEGYPDFTGSYTRSKSQKDFKPTQTMIPMIKEIQRRRTVMKSMVMRRSSYLRSLKKINSLRVQTIILNKNKRKVNYF